MAYALLVAARQDVLPVTLNVPAALALNQIPELNHFKHGLQIVIRHSASFHFFLGVWIQHPIGINLTVGLV